jgi:hypothetical protein
MTSSTRSDETWFPELFALQASGRSAYGLASRPFIAVAIEIRPQSHDSGTMGRFCWQTGRVRRPRQKNAASRLQERYIGLRRGDDEGPDGTIHAVWRENAKIGVGGATSANIG